MGKRRKVQPRFELTMSKLHTDTFEGEKRRKWLYGFFTKQELNELKAKGWRR